MKNNKHILITLMSVYLAICIALLNFSGCSVKAYAPEIYESDSEISEFPAGEEPRSSVVVFGQKYDIAFSSYKISSYTNERIEKYHLIDNERGSISFDKDGDIVKLSFLGRISNDAFDLESTEDIRKSIEAELDELADFSVYNDFSLTTWAIDGTLDMKWQVVRDLPCNISVHLVVKKGGEIVTFLKTNACPEHLTKQFISDQVRDELLLQESNSRHTDCSIESISIESEILSLYKGENALLCTVKSVDKDGWSYLDVVVIH